MPAYDYRCTQCGQEMELVHRISETVTHHPHAHPTASSPCDGALERLIGLVGLNGSVGTKGPSDGQLERAGFTKYVRGSKGYEKAFGKDDQPSYLRRE